MGGGDYGYTEPYSQGDPQSLVWLQSDCETRRIKRIITQTSQWSPITPWHTPLRRFISHKPDYCVYVCLCSSICGCACLFVLMCVHACMLINVHQFACVAVYVCVYEHLWNRHPLVCTALNISLLGTLRVNAWNLRHVQYRESCKGGKKQAVVWQLLCLFSILWCHFVCEGVHVL